jgi:phage baseplate assembly protein gpV
MADEIRIGKVSSVDAAAGMVKVVYTDRDGATTKALPVFSFTGEYKMPEVDQYVLVAHLSNGSEAGVVLGSFWNNARKSAATGKGVFRKELASKQGEAFLQYKDGTLEIHADNIKLVSAAGTRTLAEIISKLNQI